MARLLETLETPWRQAAGLLSAVILAGLAGCAAPVAPAVPKEVKVPVAVPCQVEIPDCGTYELDRVGPDDRLIVVGRAAIKEIGQREKCERRLRAALLACTKENAGRPRPKGDAR